MFDFLIARKYGQKDRQVKVSFRELKLKIYWPTTDQKVGSSNLSGRARDISLGHQLTRAPIELRAVEIAA